MIRCLRYLWRRLRGRCPNCGETSPNHTMYITDDNFYYVCNENICFSIAKEAGSQFPAMSREGET